MKKLLITGGSGLLGREVTDLAEKSGMYEVFSISSNEYNLLSLSSRKSLINNIKPEYLIHLAWDQSPGFRNSDENEKWADASLDLMKLFQQNGGQRFLFAGSSSEYDAEDGIFSEIGGSAKTKYGLSKRKVTETVTANGYVSARYFTIYGKNDRHTFGAIPSAINALLNNKNIVCHSPETLRDYIHVIDAARATIKLLQSDLIGAINIASGKARTMYEVFTLIGSIIGRSELISFENQSGEVLLANIDRMKNELSYIPEMEFSDGIREIIRNRQIIT